MDELTLGDLPEGFEMNPDGSVDIPDLEAVAPEQEQPFDVNLAEVLGAKTLSTLGIELADLVQKDKTSRKKRDEQYEEGIRRTGLGDDAPGGAEFEGASKVVHPVLAEACVDFSARAIKELFPSQGPVKPFVAGEANPEKLERAHRKAQFMNWQLTEQMREYREELEQLLTQLPMGGSQYQKFWYDERLRRPRAEFVPVDELYVPYAATSFYTAARVTHCQPITKAEFNNRVKSGLYRDIFVMPTGSTPELSLSGEATNKIEGREDDGYNEDGLRNVLEIYLDYQLDDPLTAGEVAPYIITIDEDTEEVLAIYRNWEMGDPLFTKLDWFVEWKFIPWRGAYGIGLPHLIGGLSAALTGALRALLDSAHINNAATMLKLKGGRIVGQNKQVNVTQVCEIEGPASIDDIRKVAMPMPFNPPSPVLAQLMDGLYNLAKGVVSTADEKLAQVGDRTPVGTTMSLIEQGSPIYSAIHARLHESQKRALQIIQRIDRVYFGELNFAGYDAASIEPNDFLQTPDVVPVSDPTIFSEAQRFAQVQALVQMSADQSVQWNKLALYKRVLKQMRIEAPEEVLPSPPQPVTAEATSENDAALLGGQMLKAAPQQDHMLHVQSHIAAISVPWVLQNELVPVQFIANIVAHINEHIQMMLSVAIANTAQQIIVQMQMQAQAMGLPPQQINPEQVALQAQQQVTQQLAPQLQQMTAQLMQINQVVKQRTPPPQLPPEVQATIQIAQMEIARKEKADAAALANKQAENQVDNQFETAAIQMKAGEQQFKQQLEMQRLAMDKQAMELKAMVDRLRADNELVIEQLRQQVELRKNARDNVQKSQTELLKNTDDNETAIEINEARNDAATERAIIIEQMRQGANHEVRKDV